jgi:hypothetical protein
MCHRIHRYSVVLLVAAAASCGDYRAPTAPPLPAPPPPAVQLKDIEIATLPSPFYHFEYDATGRVSVASFASGLTQYDVHYVGGRISEMLQNSIAVNKDRLSYFYDTAGRVAEVRYVDASGNVYARVRLSYDGVKLIGLQRDHLLSGAFIVEKTMSFSYDANGNVSVVSEHHPAIAGVQDEATFVDHYEQYDTGINVDGFGLIHSEFFDNLVLLPEVQLQKNNPGLVTRSGDGLTFRVQYTYTYDPGNRPLTQTGDLTVLNGSDAGRHIQTSTVYSYY